MAHQKMSWKKTCLGIEDAMRWKIHGMEDTQTWTQLEHAQNGRCKKWNMHIMNTHGLEHALEWNMHRIDYAWNRTCMN